MIKSTLTKRCFSQNNVCFFKVEKIKYLSDKSTRVSFTRKRYGSLLTRVSHLSPPSDGLSSFPQDHTRNWCQGRAENSVPKIFILERESNQEPVC